MTEQLRKEAFLSHKEDLKLQMMSNSGVKKQSRMDYLEEGRQLRVAQADEILKLETIKANKLNELQNYGIQQKYIGELQRHKIAI